MSLMHLTLKKIALLILLSKTAEKILYLLQSLFPDDLEVINVETDTFKSM